MPLSLGFLVGPSRRAAKQPARTRRSRVAVVAISVTLFGQTALQLTPVAPAAVATAAGPVAVTVAAGTSGSVPFTVDVPARPPAADILIAIDTTGSMGPSIAQAKADATDIVSGVKASVADSHFAVVDFKDSGDGSNEYRVTAAMTGVTADVQTAINAMGAAGGATHRRRSISCSVTAIRR